jgi:hypothetical protein
MDEKPEVACTARGTGQIRDRDHDRDRDRQDGKENVAIQANRLREMSPALQHGGQAPAGCRPRHRRKTSANVPYQFPTMAGATGTTQQLECPKREGFVQGVLSRGQCCPAPSGDTDDVLAEGPSPANTQRHNTPRSQETNETSHVTSHKKPRAESGLQSEDSLGFFECSESLGCDRSSSSASASASDGAPMPGTGQDSLMRQEPSDADLKLESEGPRDSELTEVLGLDTLTHLVVSEQRCMADPYYLEKSQKHLTWSMRMILLDWMMEVCAEFRLKRDTFHSATNFVDRYLTLVPDVEKSQLQLVGVTALYAAAKLEGIDAPKAADFAQSTDGCYTVGQIVAMEVRLVTVSFICKLAGPWMASGFSDPQPLGQLVHEPMGPLHPAVALRPQAPPSPHPPPPPRPLPPAHRALLRPIPRTDAADRCGGVGCAEFAISSASTDRCRTLRSVDLALRTGQQGGHRGGIHRRLAIPE